VTLDLAIPSRGITPGDALTLARAAEGRGWRSIWLSEVLDIDAIALASAILVSTSRLVVGTAIVPATTRSAAVLAMAASTLDRLAPGRFRLGIGVSTPALVGGAHDRAVQRPVAEMAGVLEVVRTALSGERVDHDAHPRVQGLRIVAPDRPTPVELAALGPRMTELAIREADGLILNLVPDEVAAKRAGLAKLARGPGYPVSMLVRTVVDPTPAERSSLRKEVTSYLRVPAYADVLRSAGHTLPDLSGPLNEATERLPDALLDAVTIQGTAEECRTRIDAMRAASVDVLVVPAAGPDALARTVEALSPEPEGLPT
jgi:probable F420-dependent oxidoreductase